MPDLHATPVLAVEFDERRDLGLADAFGVCGERPRAVVDVVQIVVGQDVAVLQIDHGRRFEFEQAGAERLVLQGRQALVEREPGEFAPDWGAVERRAVVEAEQAANAPRTGLRA